VAWGIIEARFDDDEGVDADASDGSLCGVRTAFVDEERA
jgi:hypothetical protein